MSKDRQRPVTLIRRGSVWYLKRRVPKAFQDVEQRKVIWKALEACTEAAAEKEADRFWSRLLTKWRRQKGSPAETRLEAAKRQAEALGYRYQPIDVVAELPLYELLDRIKSVVTEDGSVDLDLAEVLLGGLSFDGRLSACFERFLQYTDAPLHRFSPRQRQQWISRRRHALHTLIDVVGDVSIRSLTGMDFAGIRTRWYEDSGQSLSAVTINSRLYHLAEMLELVAQQEGFTLSFDLRKLRYRNITSGQRPSFSSEWIQDRILAKGALDGLDLQARCVLLALVNTGCRLSEIANLMPEEIRIDGTIPYISLSGRYRPLKRKTSYRDIPLFGVSLEAMRLCPTGFPAYRDSANLSKKLMRYLREHGLLETDDHCVHSLRHSFEDRVYALSRLCCTNRVRDSSRESSVVA